MTQSIHPNRPEPSPQRQPVTVIQCLGITFMVMFFTLIISLSASASEDAADQQTAVATVDSLHSELISVMKEGPELSLEGRYERLLPIVGEHFDVALIARIALGRQWASLGEEHRRQYVDCLHELIAARYASRISEFSGQVFETLSSESTSSDRIAVRSQLTRAEGDTVSLHYRLFTRKDQWRIYDVVSEGVSDLSMMRSEFSEAFRESGFEGLTEILEERIAKYRTPS
mgnify:CR=1 FL=1